jgi:hypothetical protein
MVVSAEVRLVSSSSQIPRPLTDAEVRSLRARVGAYILHAVHDPRLTTAKAREAFLAQFEDEVDPEHKLSEADRKQRADSARRAYFARLALERKRSRVDCSDLPVEGRS